MSNEELRAAGHAVVFTLLIFFLGFITGTFTGRFLGEATILKQLEEESWQNN
jgi:hypothetical protein